MKKISITVFFLFLATTIFADFPFEGQRYYYYTDAEGDWFFEFSDGIFSLYESSKISSIEVPLPGFEEELSAFVITGSYSIEEINGFIYLDFAEHKYLILYNEDIYCVLYDLNSKNSYFGKNRLYKRMRQYGPYFYTPEFEKSVRISDSLYGSTKDGISYRPPFMMFQLGAVWAYSLLENKIHWISFEPSWMNSGIVIINGFVYPKNMDYYYFNARAKRIRVIYDDVRVEIVLEDTPNPQLFYFDKKPNPESVVKIEVLEHYRGSKYNDGVISFITILGEDK
jgi:hypothetical protein